MKPAFIIDCSMTMAWCFEDEKSDEASRIQDLLAAEAAIVPIHWPLEVVNVLATAEKRKRISAADSTQFLKLLSIFDIRIDEQGSGRAFGHVFPLCRDQALTSYDAAYLDLAIRSQLPLATLDDDLRRAATSLGVELLGR